MLDRRQAIIGAAAMTALPAFAQHRLLSGAEWDKVVADARKEGEVSFYSSGVARVEEPLMKGFEAATGIKVKYARPGGAEVIVRKLQTEIGAGRPLADVASMTDKALGIWAEQEKMTAPMAVPNVANIDPAYPVDSLFNLPTGGFGLVIVYNTRMMTAATAPKSYADLADPKFKDMVLIGAPENAGSTTVMIKGWVQNYGWEFVEKLRKNGLAETRLQAEAAQAVARGEKPICVVAQAWAYINMKQNAPLAVAWPSDGVVFAETSLIRLRNGPNPNAALVFANYVLTPEYQGVSLATAGAYGSVKGAPPPDLFPPVASLKRMPVNLVELVAQRGEITDRWRKIMS
jgi:iron(III) transport system substrate-binding protein